jgi:hypothetical protein
MMHSLDFKLTISVCLIGVMILHVLFLSIGDWGVLSSSVK